MPDFRPSTLDPVTPGLADTVATMGHPDDVLANPTLTAAEKREVLAAWASDSHAVRDAPGFRQLDSGAVVAVDEILRALRALDGPETRPSSITPLGSVNRRPRSPTSRVFIFFRRKDDDDDDPPPAPAAAYPLAVELARRRRWNEDDALEPVAA